MPFLNAFSGKKILLLGFIFVLLVAIPLTVYILQKQQEVRSRAVAATKLYFSQPSQTTELRTLQKNVGETFDLNIAVDPGTNKNQVSFIKLNIAYNEAWLDVVDSKLVINEVAFPATLEAPSYTSGNTSVTISVGPDPAKVIKTTTKVGTITFRTTSGTGDPKITIAFTGSQVLSIASTDEPSENVLANPIPLELTIVPLAATPTAAPTATPTPRPSVAPTAAPTAPPAAGAPAAPTATPSATVAPTIAVATPTATPAAQVTVAPPGPSDSIVGIGIVGVVLSIIGGLLLLAL